MILWASILFPLSDVSSEPVYITESGQSTAIASANSSHQVSFLKNPDIDKNDFWVLISGTCLSLIVLQSLRHRKQFSTQTESFNKAFKKHLNITNNLPLGIAVMERGEIKEMNSRMDTWFKESRDLLDQLKPHLKDLGSGESALNGQIRMLTKLGPKQMQCTTVKTSPSLEEHQHLILLEDRTDQLHAKQRLEDKLIQLERHFNSSTDLLCITTLDGTILNSNPQWENTLGYPYSEMTGKNWMCYVCDEDKESAQEILQRLCDGEKVSNECLRFRHQNGDFIWLEFKASREGHLIHADIRNVTKRKLTEQKHLVMQEHVARAQKMESIGRLAGGIAHDFNNSLQVIIGNAQLVQNNPHLTPSNQKQLDDILSAAKSSAQLTRQLLGFAMKQHVQAANTNLNEALKATEPMFKTILGDQIQLEWHLDSELWTVNIDRSQLEQVCMNLIENAKNAMPRGGTVTITTQNKVLEPDNFTDWHIEFTPGEYVSFSIQDEGTGIDPSIHPSLFEPFSTTQDASQSSGLGLATVHGILKQNKGTIKVDSVLNKGTCFEVFLPKEKDESSRDGQLDLPLNPQNNAKIILVDDNPQILQMGMMVLQQLDYEVITCNNPTEFLDILEKNPDVSLMITDVLMPKISGMELYNSAVKLRPDIKCVFMSGYSQDVIDSGTLKPGKSVFISKPFTIKTIQETLSQLMLPKQSQEAPA